MEQETVTVGVTSGLLGSITTWIGLYLKSRMTQKVEIKSQPPTRLEPNPLEVRLVDKFVTIEEFNAMKTKNSTAHLELFGKVADFVPKKDFEAHALEDRGDHAELFQTIRAHEAKDADNRAGISQQLGNIDGKQELIINQMKNLQDLILNQQKGHK
jgi:hypothetical protein